MKKFSITELLIYVVSAELVGAVSALLSGSYGFYSELKKPPFSPPGWIFPIVWALLYALMGISAYIVSRYEDKPDERAAALISYIAQLAVNFSWSIIFFRFKAFTLAAVTAVLLLILVSFMISRFVKISRNAAFLNLPYLAWSIFAAYLAVGTSILN